MDAYLSCMRLLRLQETGVGGPESSRSGAPQPSQVYTLAAALALLFAIVASALPSCQLLWPFFQGGCSPPDATLLLPLMLIRLCAISDRTDSPSVMKLVSFGVAHVDLEQFYQLGTSMHRN